MRFIKISGVLALLALVVAVPTVLALAFTDRDFQQPDGFVGQPYSFTFDARAGCPPYHFVVINGNLPPGLTLSLDGHLTGTPNTPGKFSYWVDLYDDSRNGVCTVSHAQREFTIEIDRGLSILTQSTPGATVGQPYSLQLAVDAGVNATWRLAKGNLPDGLALSSAGAITGTPTKSGSFAFSVIATDSSNGRTAGASYTINVIDPLKLTLATPQTSLPGTTCAAGEVCTEVGAASSITITPTATGGNTSAPYKWSVAPGLPAGMTMDAGTGVISGQPTAAGTYALTLTVTDAGGGTQTAKVTIKVAAKLKIDATQHVGPVKQRKAFSIGLKTVGGFGSIIWRTQAGRFPNGVRLDPKTGVLSGTPTKAGRYRFVLEASDQLGAKSVRNYLLVVTPAKKVKKH